LRLLPRATVRDDVPQPIFILGFPRSGTTLVEQTLSAHPKIAAGDELPLIHEITAIMPRMLASPLGYPEALAELWMGDQREGLDNLRDYYLQKVRQLGVLRKSATRFTDKMGEHQDVWGFTLPRLERSRLNCRWRGQDTISRREAGACHRAPGFGSATAGVRRASSTASAGVWRSAC
jgi:hypothetical protein